jgi:phenylacetate-CoA ligase
MHAWVARNLFYRPATALRGEPVGRCRAEVRAFHRLEGGGMREAQRQKLVRLLQFLWEHNAYYRGLMEDNSIGPGRFHDLEPLRRFPILTKEAVKQRQADMLSRAHLRSSIRKTSGSTGLPLRFVKDRPASAYMEAVMQEAYEWHGIRTGDRQGRIWGVPLDPRQRWLTRLKDGLLNRVRLVSFAMSEESCRRFHQELRRFRPVFLYGLVNTTVEFVRTCRILGLDPGALGLRVVITTGEVLFPHHRRLLAEAFGCPVVNEYGTTENGIIAMECPRGGMHLMSHNLVVEFLDPGSGRPVAPGELGEVVVTELHSLSLPFVRYRTGDLARPSDRLCGCGLATPLVDEVVGRQSDLLALAGGRRGCCTAIAYSMTEEVWRFRAIQRRPEELHVLLQGIRPLRDEDLARIQSRLREALGADLHLRLEAVAEIPPDPSGKFRYFVSSLEDGSAAGS